MMEKMMTIQKDQETKIRELNAQLDLSSQDYKPIIEENYKLKANLDELTQIYHEYKDAADEKFLELTHQIDDLEDEYEEINSQLSLL
jgi:chromosome segregation ATPase